MKSLIKRDVSKRYRIEHVFLNTSLFELESA